MPCVLFFLLFAAASVHAQVEYGSGCPGVCTPPTAARVQAHFTGLTSGCSDTNGLPCIAGEVIQFSAVYTPGCGSCSPQFHWDFGDGTSASGLTANHVYSYAGVFPAAFTLAETAGSFTIPLPVVIAGGGDTLGAAALILLACALAAVAAVRLY